MTDPRTDAVVVTDLVKDFRMGLGIRSRRILEGISFRVRQGEIFGFVGPNGAGKTTTLKILMGLIHATAGGARILGHDIRETAFRRHVGFLPENPCFYDYLTGNEFLGFYAGISGVPTGERAGRIRGLLEKVGLGHAGDLRLRTYSKGMLQRIGIAQALIHEPSVLFLDEPMSGLDPIGRKEIRDLILQLHAQGTTVFMNTHILSDVEMICDRVAIIVEGRIRYEGRIDDFLDEGGRWSDVVLSGLSPELVERFEEGFAAEVRGRGENIELRIREKQVSELLGTALSAGAEVRSVTPHRVSLESVFLTAVAGGSGGDDAGEKEESR